MVPGWRIFYDCWLLSSLYFTYFKGRWLFFFADIFRAGYAVLFAENNKNGHLGYFLYFFIEELT